MALAFRPRVRVLQELDPTVGADIVFRRNVVENADTPTTSAHQPLLGDVRMGLSVAPFLTDLDSDTQTSIRLDTTFERIALRSLASQAALRVIGLQRGLACVVTEHGLPVTKHFVRYTNAVIDSESRHRPPVARGGSTTALDGFPLATGAGNTEWCIGNVNAPASRFVDRWTLSSGFEFDVAASYSRHIQRGRFSSPHTPSNRGLLEFMRGQNAMSLQLTPHLAIALGTATEQPPLGPARSTARSPWWAHGNSAENRQVFYLDIVGAL